MTDAPRRPARPQSVFEVVRASRLSPHLVRVHLGGPAFDTFVAGADPERLAATDKYVKLSFEVPDGQARRTYTVRSVDHEAKTIAIDFVVHGDEGIAGPWAAAAQPGDLLTLSGPGGVYSPSADQGVQHLLLGDDSAIPAIAAALEAMVEGATGLAVLEVDGPDDELALAAPVGVEVQWVHRRSSDGSGTVAAPGTALVDAARELSAPTGPVSVFAHGERSAVKALREVFFDDWGLERRTLSISAYWALGRAEDRFQAEKREPVGQIFAD